MKFVLCFSIILLITMSSPSAKAADPWTLYDNFNSEFLDIGKWGESQTKTGGVVALEEVREIEGQRLYMLIRAHGPTQGGMQRGDKSIAFPQPNTIRGVKASIKVSEVEATQCPITNSQSTRARARFSGSFFNTLGGCGSLPTPCGQAYDAVAQILIQRHSNSPDKPGILRIVGEVFECLDSSCFQNSNYQSVELGTVRVGQWATVSVELDDIYNQFIFQLDKKPPQVIENVMPIASQPNSPYKLLGVGARIPYCAPDGQLERQVGLIGADFENVFVK
jgi:hypothetical protein